MLLSRITILLLATLAGQSSASCEGAPVDAVVSVPAPLAAWMAVECSEKGHTLSPTAAYEWRANTNGRSLSLPALGVGGIPANVINGTPLIVGRSGAYAPLLGGRLMDPHDAYFKRSRLTRMEGELLAAANQQVQGQQGVAGPYPEGYLLDLLSNQTFEYRLYLLASNNEPRVLLALFNAPGQASRRVVLLVSKRSAPS